MSDSFRESLTRLATAAKERHCAAFYPAEISRLGVATCESDVAVDGLFHLVYAEEDRRVAAQEAFRRAQDALARDRATR